MDRTYPYTQMDKKHEIMSENRQNPPPYESYDTPCISSYRPAPAVAPAAMPAIMPTIVTVNNVGGGTGGVDTSGGVAVGPKPVIMNCPHCRCRNKTRTKGRSTLKTHLACLFLSWTGLCCLPYCLNSCRNIDHFCTMCGAYLGTYEN